MSTTVATILLVLFVAALIAVLYGIEKAGADESPVIYGVWLVAMPIMFVLMWAANGRGIPLWTMLLAGVGTGMLAAVVWRIHLLTRRR